MILMMALKMALMMALTMTLIMVLMMALMMIPMMAVTLGGLLQCRDRLFAGGDGPQIRTNISCHV